MNASSRWGAIVLAGGAARRLGGVDKPLLAVEGSALLVRVLSAVPQARPAIVVGPPDLRQVLPGDVDLIQEDPPGGGPVAAIRAGVALLPSSVETVAVLAGDLPFLTASVLSRLRDSLRGSDVALLTDADGRRQFLLGVWRTRALRAALSKTASAAMRELLSHVRVAEVAPGDGRPWFDCDTPEDLAEARRIAGDYNASSSNSASTAER